MTVSPPGHEHYFEELAELTGRSGPPDANAIAALRSRYDTDQLSALKIGRVRVGQSRSAAVQDR
jgi:hypothetical protein